MRFNAHVQPCDPARLRKPVRSSESRCRVFRRHWHLSHGPALEPERVPGVPTSSVFAATGQKIQ